jgi:hypothetical protein
MSEKCPVCGLGLTKQAPVGGVEMEVWDCLDVNGCGEQFRPWQLALARATRAAAIEEAVRPWREALTDDLTVFDYIVTADKTRYDYPPGGHGQVAKAIACKPDGTPPPTGQAWLTPKEKAEARIKVLRALLDREG